MKLCTKCKQRTPTPCQPSGRVHTWCNPCRAEAEKARRLRDPVTYRRNANASRWRQRKTECTPSLFEELLQQQGGECAICRRPRSSARALAVDHCHKTGKVRGLLCVQCNSGIGQLGDDLERLRAAVEYLERFNDFS